jgi:hypothetical protein
MRELFCFCRRELCNQPGVSIPLMAKKKSKQRTEEIPEDEQWRMINDSGILSGGSSTKIPKPSSDSNTTTYDLADELFFATLLIIPFSFLFLLFDM